MLSLSTEQRDGAPREVAPTRGDGEASAGGRTVTAPATSPRASATAPEGPAVRGGTGEASAVPATLAGLPAWLAAREAAQPPLIPGTEKQIVWHDGPQRRAYAVVYLHGFSASRQETHPFALRIAEGLGGNLFNTRLTGHGHRDTALLAAATVDDWMRDADEALTLGERLGERIVLVGCSTGATLATAFARQRPARLASVAAMTFVSPNFGVADPAASVFRLPFGSTLARCIAGPEYAFAPVNERHARFWTTRYPTEAIATMLALVARARRGGGAHLRPPVLTFYSPRDRVLDVGAITRMHRRFPNPHKRLVAVEDCTDPSQHVLAGDVLSPVTTERLARLAVDFVRALPS